MAKNSARLRVKVVPGASRSKIVGWLNDELKVRVTAPPERGKANSAVEHLIAAALQLSSGAVKIVAGSSSSHKIIEVQGLSASELRNKLDFRSV